MAFCLTPLVSWRWGLICESLAWYVWNIYLRLSCQKVSDSLITRQQREAVLSESYHFRKIWFCFDFYGQQVLHFVRLCYYRGLNWNSENVNAVRDYAVEETTWIYSFFSSLLLFSLFFLYMFVHQPINIWDNWHGRKGHFINKLQKIQARCGDVHLWQRSICGAETGSQGHTRNTWPQGQGWIPLKALPFSVQFIPVHPTKGWGY